jgi:hypothetical protein
MVKVTADNVNVYYVEWRDASSTGRRTCGQSARQAARRAVDAQRPGSGGEWQGQDRRNRCVKVGVLVVIGERDAGPAAPGRGRHEQGTQMPAESRPRGSSWIDLGSASSTGRSYYGTGAVTAG